MTAPPHSDPRLARVIAITNGKGGIGKTSCTVNVAGEWAADGAHDGIRILIVDFDPQGNAGMDLGVIQRSQGDDGASFVQALLDDADLDVLPDVRPNLDLVVGGRKLARLAALAHTPEIVERGGLHAIFADKLGELIDKNGYDLVLIDTPPGDSILQRAAAGAARYVLVPVKTDPGSWDGLRGTGPVVRIARENGNPDITYLGIVVCFNAKNATRILQTTRTWLTEAFPTIPVFDTVIRSGDALAQAGRSRGQLARELPADAAASKQKRLQQLHDGTYDRSGTEALPENAGDVATSYRHLAFEIIQRLQNHEGNVQNRGE